MKKGESGRSKKLYFPLGGPGYFRQKLFWPVPSFAAAAATADTPPPPRSGGDRRATLHRGRGFANSDMPT